MVAFELSSPREQAALPTAPFHVWAWPAGGDWMQFFRTGRGFILRFPNLADFSLSADGNNIVCVPVPGVSQPTLEHLYLNQVLPLTLGKQGCMVFHGSAVTLDAGAVVFLVGGRAARITLVPSLTEADTKEPARFSIFSDGHDHIVTVTRNAAGEFVASAQPLIGRELQQASGDGDGGSSSTLYSSVYHAGLMQRLPPETIQQILRVNAFDTDFRRRVRPGDSVELFFDMKDEQSTDGPPGEMLYSAVSSGGQIYRYYRFRSGDGVVDYYDTEGNNSKKFLMRKPVRGDDVRPRAAGALRA